MTNFGTTIGPGIPDTGGSGQPHDSPRIDRARAMTQTPRVSATIAAIASRTSVHGRSGNATTGNETMELRPQDATDPETDLLARVARGDRAAFERLYRATSPRLLGVCLRLVADRGEAEDVLQEVYVSAWRKAPQFDPQKSSAAVWLAAIARHRAIDRLRASAGLREQAPIELAETQADPAPAPSLKAESDSENARLDNCVGQLEPRRRSLIRTAFFEGATYEELATRSGSPLGSVKSWIRRGLLQLRACLEA